MANFQEMDRVAQEADVRYRPFRGNADRQATVEYIAEKFCGGRYQATILLPDFESRSIQDIEGGIPWESDDDDDRAVLARKLWGWFRSVRLRFQPIVDGFPNDKWDCDAYFNGHSAQRHPMSTTIKFNTAITCQYADMEAMVQSLVSDPNRIVENDECWFHADKVPLSNALSQKLAPFEDALHGLNVGVGDMAHFVRDGRDDIGIFFPRSGETPNIVLKWQYLPGGAGTSPDVWDGVKLQLNIHVYDEDDERCKTQRVVPDVATLLDEIASCAQRMIDNIATPPRGKQGSGTGGAGASTDREYSYRPVSMLREMLSLALDGLRKDVAIDKQGLFPFNGKDWPFPDYYSKVLWNVRQRRERRKWPHTNRDKQYWLSSRPTERDQAAWEFVRTIYNVPEGQRPVSQRQRK